MKIKDGFIVREVGGTGVAVPVGEASEKFPGMVTLNDTGMFLWSKMASGSTRGALISALLDEYDVDEATAANDVDKFIESLRGADLLEE